MDATDTGPACFIGSLGVGSTRSTYKFMLVLFSRKELSAAAFKRAVSLNPFQWSTFENLCRMKETIDPKETFFRAIASKSSRSLDVHSDDDSQLDSPPSEDVDMVPAEEVVAKVSSVITSSPLPAKSVLVKKPIPKTADKSVVGKYHAYVSDRLRFVRLCAKWSRDSELLKQQQILN